ncbi:hypothetical protein HK096_003910 [Nowakowskiella sp. JEL0078]|nr:hypothetical protein HK096_003910 [Nowakowskiella sp. JEL0078]
MSRSNNPPPKNFAEFQQSNLKPTNSPPILPPKKPLTYDNVAHFSEESNNGIQDPYRRREQSSEYSLAIPNDYNARSSGPSGEFDDYRGRPRNRSNNELNEDARNGAVKFGKLLKEKAGSAAAVAIEKGSVWTSFGAGIASRAVNAGYELSKQASSNAQTQFQKWKAPESIENAPYPQVQNQSQKWKEYESSMNSSAAQIFGEPLKIAVERSRIDPEYHVPAVITRCVLYLESTALEEVGIYRLSGSTTLVNHLKMIFNQNGDCHDVEEHVDDPHAISSLLKLYLRELPDHILTDKLREEFNKLTAPLNAAITNSQNNSDADLSVVDPKILAHMRHLVSFLPIENYSLLAVLGRHLSRVAAMNELNKMTFINLQLIFSQTLLISSPVLRVLIEHWFELFTFPYPGITTSSPGVTPSSPTSNILVERSSSLAVKSRSQSRTRSDNPIPNPRSSSSSRDAPTRTATPGDDEQKPKATFKSIGSGGTVLNNIVWATNPPKIPPRKISIPSVESDTISLPDQEPDRLSQKNLMEIRTIYENPSYSSNQNSQISVPPKPARKYTPSDASSVLIDRADAGSRASNRSSNPDSNGFQVSKANIPTSPAESTKSWVENALPPPRPLSPLSSSFPFELIPLEKTTPESDIPIDTTQLESRPLSSLSSIFTQFGINANPQPQLATTTTMAANTTAPVSQSPPVPQLNTKSNSSSTISAQQTSAVDATPLPILKPNVTPTLFGSKVVVPQRIGSRRPDLELMISSPTPEFQALFSPAVNSADSGSSPSAKSLKETLSAKLQLANTAATHQVTTNGESKSKLVDVTGLGSDEVMKHNPFGAAVVNAVIASANEKK